MRGIAVPKGIPADRKTALQEAFANVMKDPEFIAHADKMGLPLSYMSADEFDEYLSTAAAAVEGYIHLLK